MFKHFATVIFAIGLAQLSVLVASALVPIRLKWRSDLAVLPRLHRQLYWVYGGYTVLTIIGLGLVCLTRSTDLAIGTPLARSVCLFGMIFWGVRLSLQAMLDAKAHLTTWWLRVGYHTLTMLFICFTIVYALAAFRQTS
jgi:hypothetical protein